ncbi:MAG: DUF2235 domain-containing protein [Flavobacteriales bacterium]|nr:DUF2235 domain-containing protein [Flavobacteriales bacterium]
MKAFLNEGIPNGISITLNPIQNQETKVVEQVVDINKIKIEMGERPFPVEIEFLGVWDTVSALGLANNTLRFIGAKKDDLFTNESIAHNIQRAVHLPAIDGTRNPFVPSLMNYKEGVTHEVWFPGVHSDIGGSYKEDDIAQASLHYMIKCMEEWNKERKLQDFIFDDKARELYTKAQLKKAHFHFHGKALGKDLRPIHVQADGVKSERLIPKIHHLYYDIASQKISYSIFEIKKFLRKPIEKSINFQYMPFNVKVLEGKYEIVS